MPEDFYFPEDLASYFRRRRVFDPLNVSPPGVELPDVATEQPTGERFPSLTEYRRYLQTAPKMEEFQPGKLRRVLAVLAGGLAGAGEGPGVGYEVGRRAVMGPFLERQKAFELGVAPRKEAAEIELLMEKARAAEPLQAARISELGARTEAERARAGAERRRGTTVRLRRGEQLRDPSGKLIAEGAPEEKEFRHYDPERGELTVFDPSKPDEAKVFPIRPPRPEKPGTAFAEALKRREERLGRKLTDEEVVALQRELPSPTAEALRGQELGRREAEFSPETISYYAEQMKTSPDIFHELDPKLKPSVAQRWTRDTGLPPPTKLSADVARSELVAFRAKDHVAFIRQMVRNPKIQPFIGPMMGRIGKGEQFIGGDMRGVPPELQAQAQELRNRLNYLLVQEAAALSPGRAVATLLNFLKQSAPDVRMALPFLAGALNAVAGNAEINLQAADEARFGGKRRQKTIPWSEIRKRARETPDLRVEAP